MLPHRDALAVITKLNGTPPLNLMVQLALSEEERIKIKAARESKDSTDKEVKSFHCTGVYPATMM